MVLMLSRLLRGLAGPGGRSGPAGGTGSGGGRNRTSMAVELALFTLTVAGLASMAVFIRSVYASGAAVLPEWFFWASVAASAAGMTSLWAYSESEVLVLGAIVIAAVVMVSVPFLRFYFYGVDLVGEYFVAGVTQATGVWSPERVTGVNVYLDRSFSAPEAFLHRYFSTTSVTVLPAIISQISGASMRTVFWVMMVTVSAASTVICYAATKLCFGRRVAALSSIVFVFSAFYMKFATILREGVALMFLFLATYYILRGGKGAKLIALISLSILPMSHYGMVFFAVFFIALLLVARWAYENQLISRLLTKISPGLGPAPLPPLPPALTSSPSPSPSPSPPPPHDPPHSSASIPLPAPPPETIGGRISISGTLLLYTFVAGFSWLIFVGYPIYVTSLGGVVESASAILGLGEVKLSYMQQYAVFSSLGPLHTAAKWLERVAALLGAFIALRLYGGRRAFAFTLLGIGVLALGLLLAVLPSMSSLFDLDRTMQVSLIGFSAFIAVAASALVRRTRIGIGAILTAAFVALILLDTVQVPILYTPASGLSQEDHIFSYTRVFTYYEPSDFEFAGWVGDHTNASSTFASDPTGSGLSLISNRFCVGPRGANASDTIAILELGRTDYYLYLSYGPQYLHFATGRGEPQVFNETEVSRLLESPSLNRIYDNSRAILFSYG